MASSPDPKKNDVVKVDGNGNVHHHRSKLPAGLQKIIDENEKDDSLYEELWGGRYVLSPPPFPSSHLLSALQIHKPELTVPPPSAPESTESSIRYAAYATRIRTAVISAQRYVAYTSDIGESFRPVAHPNYVRAAYGISFAYVAGDVAHEGYKAYWANHRVRNPDIPVEVVQDHYSDARSPVPDAVTQALKPGVVPPLEDYRTVMLQRGVFQTLASLVLPAFTIHSIVRYSGRAMRDVKNVRVRTWGPIGLGLGAVPFLPYLFDKPVEDAVEFAFHTAFKAFGGQPAVGDAPVTGREHQLEEKPEREL